MMTDLFMGDAIERGISRPMSAFLRHQFLYICGKITLTSGRSLTGPLPGKARHEIGKLQQVYDPKECASLPDNDFRIRGDRVGPLRRNRANGPVIDPQQQPLAGAVIPLADADERLAAVGVERMRYPHKLRRSAGKTCILS